MRRLTPITVPVGTLLVSKVPVGTVLVDTSTAATGARAACTAAASSWMQPTGS